jgi:2'-5' RNA ligase
MRLFSAIDLPDEVRANLKTFLDRLRPTVAISWSRAENLHVTTKFIGEWPEERLEEMKSALRPVRSAPFAISIRGTGFFPNARNPRVFWIGVESGPELGALAAATEDAVAGLGVAREDRKYSPHLTLARIRERVPLEALMRAVEAPVEFGSFQVSAFYLYLSRAGRYTKLGEFQFA